ncbi:hypothetical protein ABL78_4632 [Leptomonas seymouri]|uniref:Uncharacterized protein n=1 Tax=Leptomonas seymouri TaxID=5684 RepID=A0A0N0P5S5_LEPSE|nr:hypothetical protein ABL78_4632 [Leptomonas seymouri]|eukprot:KPI86327.1 hypothetical protein ABL78_4632 [Leptomonas seymouri]
MSAIPCNAQMLGFEVLDAQSNTCTKTSAPLYAALSFRISFKVREPVVAPALFVAVDFIADVASEQPPVPLLPLRPVAPADLVNSFTKTSESLNAAVLSSSSPATNEGSIDTLSLLLSPHATYALTFSVADLSKLRAIPLKHLLQVSVMRVRLATAVAGANTEENTVATWKAVWQVRRDPQNNQELVRTLLSPLS